MALVGGIAYLGCAGHTGARRAGIAVRASVIVAAERAIGLVGIRTHAVDGIAHSIQMTCIWRRALYGILTRACASHAYIAGRAGASIVAGAAIRLIGIVTQARENIARAWKLACAGGRADYWALT